MTVWLSSPGGGGTIPGFCWKGRKEAVRHTCHFHNRFEPQNHFGIAQPGRLGLQAALGAGGMQCEVLLTEGTAPPRAHRRADLLPYKTLQKLNHRELSFHMPRCGLCSLHPLWAVRSTLHRTTEYRGRHSPRPAVQT